MAFLNNYGCRLPWMNEIDFGNGFDLCPILGHPNGTYHNLVTKWYSHLTSFDLKRLCQFQPPCTRSIYDKSLEDWIWDSVPMPSTHEAKLRIQLSNPDVQVIQDQFVYDTQSLIGEVGGTMGIFLGLSCLSILDLIKVAFTYFGRRFIHDT